MMIEYFIERQMKIVIKSYWISSNSFF